MKFNYPFLRMTLFALSLTCLSASTTFAGKEDYPRYGRLLNRYYDDFRRGIVLNILNFRGHMPSILRDSLFDATLCALANVDPAQSARLLLDKVQEKGLWLEFFRALDKTGQHHKRILIFPGDLSTLSETRNSSPLPAGLHSLQDAFEVTVHNQNLIILLLLQPGNEKHPTYDPGHPYILYQVMKQMPLFNNPILNWDIFHRLRKESDPQYAQRAAGDFLSLILVSHKTSKEFWDTFLIALNSLNLKMLDLYKKDKNPHPQTSHSDQELDRYQGFFNAEEESAEESDSAQESDQESAQESDQKAKDAQKSQGEQSHLDENTGDSESDSDSDSDSDGNSDHDNGHAITAPVSSIHDQKREREESSSDDNENAPRKRKRTQPKSGLKY